jgi:methylmalonyl-CoA/ethylmalonyl-CoA epimerase
VIRGIHHVAIAVRRLSEAYHLYRDLFGLPLVKEAAIANQGVRAALLAAGDSEIELLEPLDANGGVARFLARHGEGLHHVCFETEDVGAELTAAKDKGAELIDATPRPGLAGQIGFLHPRACAGVLVELATIELAGSRAHATPAPAANVARSQHQSGLRFKRLIIGAEEPRATASIFQRLFGFPEVAMNGGPRVMLGVGHGTLLLVPDGDVGGREGMVALSMVAENFDDLLAAFQRKGTRGVLLGTGEVTLEPVATHGVHLHISKYE